MKLTKLELSGFKSFADSVTLTFADGVTATINCQGLEPTKLDCRVR
jgi:chromosome segregation ATPase